MEPELNIKIRDEDHITVTNNKKASLKMYSIIFLIFFIIYFIYGIASGTRLLIVLGIGIIIIIAFFVIVLNILLQAKEYINISGESIKLVSQYKRKTITLYSHQVNGCYIYDNTYPGSNDYGAFLYIYYENGKYWRLGLSPYDSKKIFDFLTQYFQRRNIPVTQIDKRPDIPYPPL
mgnify:CR=1 FL=1